MLAWLTFPTSSMGCAMSVCEIRDGYTYLVASWNNFYDYKISSPPHVLSHVDCKGWFTTTYKFQHNIMVDLLKSNYACVLNFPLPYGTRCMGVCDEMRVRCTYHVAS